MAELNLNLPSFSDMDTAEEQQKVKSYLFQLTEQLRYVLNNLGEENLTVSYATTINEARTIAESAENLACQLENNLATDYKDLLNKIVEQATHITQEFESSIEQLDNRITTEVTEQYQAIAADLASVTAEYSSKIEQNSQSIDIIISREENYVVGTDYDADKAAISGEISSLSGDISGVSSDLYDFTNKVDTYFTFGDNGITIGKSDSDFSTVLDNEALKFKEGDTVVASISNNTLDITNANVKYSLQLGGYIFKPRANHNLSLVWVGE